MPTFEEQIVGSFPGLWCVLSPHRLAFPPSPNNFFAVAQLLFTLGNCYLTLTQRNLFAATRCSLSTLHRLVCLLCSPGCTCNDLHRAFGSSPEQCPSLTSEPSHVITRLTCAATWEFLLWSSWCRCRLS